ncbi:MAG: ABC transporter permease [Gammaproteobacteria bacterium]
MIDLILDSTKQVLRSLLRLTRESRFVVTFVATLALAIAANMAVFSVLDAYLFHPLPYPKSHRLVEVFTSSRIFHVQSISVTSYRQLHHLPVFASAGLIGRRTALVKLHPGARPRILPAAEITASMFPTLAIHPLIGSWMNPRDDQPGGPRQVILSEVLWKSAFDGNPHVLGQSIIVQGKPYSIVGIMPGRFTFPSRNTALWFSTVLKRSDFIRNPYGAVNSMMIARLAHKVSFPDLKTALDADFPRLMKQASPAVQRYIRHAGGYMGFLTFRQWLVGATGKRLLIIQLGAAVLLLLALASLANLSLVRTLSRYQEYALRTALGAGTWKLLPPITGEAGILASAATLLAWPLARLGTRGFASFGIGSYRTLFQTSQSLGSWLIAWLISVALCFIVIGLPRILLTHRNPRALLNGGIRIAGSGGGIDRFRVGLSIIQIALAILLLTATLLIGISLNQILSQNPGFNLHDLYAAQIVFPKSDFRDWSRFNAVDGELSETLSQLPGISVSATGRGIPLVSPGDSSVFVKGSHFATASPHSVFAANVIVGSRTLALMGVHLLSGHLIQARDIASHARVVVVDRQMAEGLFGNLNVLGKIITFGNGPLRIVGIVGTLKDRFAHAYRSIDGTAFLPNIHSFFFVANGASDLLIRSTISASVLQHEIKTAIRRRLPNLVFEHFKSMHAVIVRSVRGTSALISLIGTFGLLALLLASVGTFGVIAYLVGMRQGEFAIRESLGASPETIMWLILKQGLWIWLAGAIIGIGSAWWVAQLLQEKLYGIQASSPSVYILPTLIVGLVVFIACAIPALRMRQLALSRILRS